MIEFQRVTKLYKTVIGVNDVSLSLEPGVYGLLGPNGSGKTTFINLVMGQLRPTLGFVKVFGQDPWQCDALLNRIGLCPALQASYPFVSGLKWVSYLTQLRGFTYRASREMARAAMEVVDMVHAMDRPMSGYSLGMRQRTVLAQAIAHNPDLLILDEPFNGLDPKGRYEMTEFLKQWVARGKSLILASHILHEVEVLEPSLLLISGGRLLASGSPSEVRSILADCPNVVRIMSGNNRQLATLVCRHWDVDCIRMDADAGFLEVETSSPLELLSELPAVAAAEQITIRELRSSDESLQQIFSTLMRIHRGEIHVSGEVLEAS